MHLDWVSATVISLVMLLTMGWQPSYGWRVYSPSSRSRAARMKFAALLPRSIDNLRPAGRYEHRYLSTKGKIPPSYPSKRELQKASPIKGMLPISFYEVVEQAPHKNIVPLAEKYLKSFEEYEKHHLIGIDTVRAFNRAIRFVDDFYRASGSNAVTSSSSSSIVKRVILDSGCGRGLSTVKLALQNPTVPVIGLDRSKARLSLCRFFRAISENDNDFHEIDATKGASSTRHRVDRSASMEDDDQEENDDSEEDNDEEAQLWPDSLPPNALLLHAELATFWLLIARKADWIIDQHWLLHPNPYHKLSHLKKRWHAHSAFPLISAIGGQLTLRSNWRTYCEEFDIALFQQKTLLSACLTSQEGNASGEVKHMSIDRFSGSPLTHFERKFLRVGMNVYQLQTQLGIRDQAQRNAFLDHLPRIRTTQSVPSGVYDAFVHSC